MEDGTGVASRGQCHGGESESSLQRGEHERDTTLSRADMCPPHFLLAGNRYGTAPNTAIIGSTELLLSRPLLSLLRILSPQERSRKNGDLPPVEMCLHRTVAVDVWAGCGSGSKWRQTESNIQSLHDLRAFNDPGRGSPISPVGEGGPMTAHNRPNQHPSLATPEQCPLQSYKMESSSQAFTKSKTSPAKPL